MSETHRQSRQRLVAGLISGQAWFGMSLIVLLISCGVLVLAWFGPRPASSLNHPQTPYHLNQTIEQGSARMAIAAVEYRDGTAAFAAPAGSHYVVVTMTVTNRSDQPINIYPATDVYLKDTAGNVSYLTPFELDSPFHAGELLPGETVRGQLSFMAPKNATYKLYIDGLWSGGVLPFALR